MSSSSSFCSPRSSAAPSPRRSWATVRTTSSPTASTPNTLQPVGPFTKISTAPFPTPVGTKGFEDTTLILGADGQLGRDMFLRILYGAQTSLEVAVFATLFSVSVGVLLGLLAGFFRGAVDTVVSRLTEIAMAFPVLLFIIAVSATVGPQLNGITFGFLAPGVFTLTLIFGIFGWFYPARIIRGQVLSLREKEFIEAARMTGAGDWRIMRSHLLPHLVAPIIVYSTLIVAGTITAEAGLSFLGLGIQAPTASWGNLLSAGPDYYLTQPWLMVWPGSDDPADDARLQPARRRHAGCVRPAAHDLTSSSVP